MREIKSAHDSVLIRDRLELYSTEDNRRIIVDPQKDDAPRVQGFFRCVLRERGKIISGSRREGENIWTLTGREHLSQLMSYGLGGSPTTPFRNDRMLYVGFGIGSQPEVAAVSSLVSPIPATPGIFLVAVGIASFPLSPSKTTVRYTHTYLETELSIGGGSVVLSEAGLFTDGDPAQSYTPGTRDATIGNASIQAPNAYKVFEPLKKTSNFVLEVNWEIRF